MPMDLRLRAYLPNGGSLGPLPAPAKLSASYVFGDLGALSLEYASNAPRSDLLGQPLEIAVETATSGEFSEPPNSRFLYWRDSRDPLRGMQDSYSIEGPSYAARLQTARVLPEGQLGADGKRAFTNATPGYILRKLLIEAQDRGALAGLTYPTFTNTKDSAGETWAQVVTIRYSVGVDYFTLLRAMHDSGLVDFSTVRRELFVYNADQAMAMDRTVDTPLSKFLDIYPADSTDPVVLRKGRDMVEAPFRRTWEGLRSYAFVQGDEGRSQAVTNPEASTPWGRQEAFVTASGIVDPGTMTVLGWAELARGSDARVERTRGLDFTKTPYLPFRNYGLGDYIFSVTEPHAAPEKLRVRQITLQSDAGKVSGNVILNDRFIEAEVAAARRIAGITVGGIAAGGSGGTPTGPGGEDFLAPSPPTALFGSTEAYLDYTGEAAAVITLTWTIPTTNVDGSSLEDLDYQLVSMRGDSPTEPWTLIDQVGPNVNISRWSPLPVNTWRRFSVIAVDRSGNRSDRSQEIRVLTARDTVAPGKPSAPVCTERLGLVVATWDGLLENGGGQPTDYFGTEVHAASTSGFTPSQATLVDTVYGAAVIPIAGRPLSQATFVKLVSTDKSGNRSTPSEPGSATPVPLVDPLPTARSITETMIALKAISEPLLNDASISNRTLQAGVVNTVNLTVGAFTESIVRNGSFSDGTLGQVPLGWTKNLTGFGGVVEQIATDGDGTRGCRLTANASLGAKIETGPLIGVRAGDVYAVRITAWSEAPVMTGFMFAAIDWCNSAGTVLSSSPPIMNSILNSNKNVFEVPVTAPTGAVLANLRIHTAVGSSPAVIGSVSMQRGVGSARILDASIIRAKIGSAAIGSAEIDALAVNDIHVMNVNVGKLTAGILRADVTVSARFKTADTGERTEFNGQGLMCFNAAGERTIHLTGVAGGAYYKGIIEGSLFRTNGSGQRMEIQSSGVAGGRTITFYPALPGRMASTVTSRDDPTTGDAGFRIDSGGFPYRSFANFTKRFLDIGIQDDGSQGLTSFIRIDDGGEEFHVIKLNARNDRYIALTTERTDWFDGTLTYGRLAHNGFDTGQGVGAGRLERVIFFTTSGASSGGDKFSFGSDPNNLTNADLYGNRYVATIAGGTGGFVYFSDEQAKEDITDADMSGALAQIKQTKVRDFKWRKNGRKSRGFIAQELPATVCVPISVDMHAETDDGLGVSVDGMQAVMWAGIQDLAAKIEDIESRMPGRPA